MNTQYIGIDVHSSTCTFCVLDAQGVELDNRTIATNGRLILDYVKSFGDHVIIAFEECDLSCWLFNILRPHVRKIIACNPAANVQYKRAKTDKLDARNLAQLLRGDFLRPVFHDGSEREKFRMLVSGYDDTVQESTRLQNRIKAIKRRTRLPEKVPQTSHAAFILKQFTGRLTHLETMKEEYQTELETQVKHFKETKYLISLPGIAYIQAARIIAHVVDPHRFKNKYKFFAYCGLVRHKRQSANRLYGSVRIFGNQTLKCVFKMAAHSALKGKGCMRQYYEALRNKGCSDKAAGNAVARKIAAITLSLWRNKKLFNEQMILNSLPVKV
jgi:transposase